MKNTQSPAPGVAAEVEAALKRAFSLGQTYWQQADSEFVSQHRKSDETRSKFDKLVEETMCAVLASRTPAPGMAGGVGADWSDEVKRRLYNTLMYYANSTTYDAPRIGGVLQGCPRGPLPTPTELTMSARWALADIEEAMGRIPPQWLTVDRPPHPSPAPQAAGANPCQHDPVPKVHCFACPEKADASCERNCMTVQASVRDAS